MILATKALLDRHPEPTERQIRKALDGNLCRCTGYVKILDAVRLAAAMLREQETGSTNDETEGAGGVR
jgi:carbon-monoxide dehydrogenase small subunit